MLPAWLIPRSWQACTGVLLRVGCVLSTTEQATRIIIKDFPPGNFH
jgi:hypothetical protein